MTATLALTERTDDLAATAARIVESDEILSPIRDMRRLADQAAVAAPDEAFGILADMTARHRSDPLAAYLALYAIAGVTSRRVDSHLVALLAAADETLAQHVAWALSRRRPVRSALPHLEEMIDRGGFARMMAELALENWLREIPELAFQMSPERSNGLLELATKPSEAKWPNRSGGGLRIAQVLMQGRVDADLSAAGSGDGGGLITLQVGLTNELAGDEAVAEVYLVTRMIRGEHAKFSQPHEPIGDGTLVRLEFGEPGYMSTAEMWAHRPELERELRDFLIGHGPFDALHLRFADVGAFAAVRLAEDLGIPIVFTLAPDPHSVLATAEESGEITRANFASAEATHHYLFRAWLVDQMLDRAHRLALLPRPNHVEQFQTLMGVDVTASERFAVIPEGVDFSQASRARRTIAGLTPSAEKPTAIRDLLRQIDEMPARRRGLPLLLTVGRLNPVKGMDRVVAAWARDTEIRSRFNLALVGGNLADPSSVERETLAAIAAALDGGGSEGLVMLGGRSHEEVALIMAAAARGVADHIGAAGIYVSGSEKEEFGLAIVEALAAGLPVVAPRVGGPATYVEHGFTGFLADTRSPEAIRDGIRWAEGTRFSDVRADAARKQVRDHYSLSAMASSLVELYSFRRAEPSAS